MIKDKIFFIVLIFISLISCKTVDLEETILLESEEIDGELLIEAPPVKEKYILIEEPEVILTLNGNVAQEVTTIEGVEAVRENFTEKRTEPEFYQGSLKAWVYKEDYVYEVYTQRYRSTLIEFEPGEVLLEVPYISEPDVWRIAQGQGLKNGLNTQYLIVKPDYSDLTSTLIVITNRRVYLMELRSSNTQYMPTVRWAYTNRLADTFILADYEQNKAEEKENRMALLSFDYKISHSIFDNPEWMPKHVYDDGIKTYIVLDEKSLLMEFPILFNERNEIINYRTDKNVIIIDQLIVKATLKLDNDKVSIQKKKA